MTGERGADVTQQEAVRGRGIPRNLSRERIVTAALTLVRESGVSMLSMRRLAAELDATVAITYHYFPNKAAVVEAVAGVVGDAVLATGKPRGDWGEGALHPLFGPGRGVLRE